MTTPHIRDIRKLSGRLGAEVVGVDLSVELDSATVAWLTEALHEHKVVGFRGQHIDDAQQLRFASYFGELTLGHPTRQSVVGQPNVMPVDSMDGARSNHWHTDVTFVLAPPKASTLRGITIPPYGGHTLFANTAAAYRDLPEPLRRLADSLKVVHSNLIDFDDATPQTEVDRARYEAFVSRRFRTVHPLVRVHPETGERGLLLGFFAERLVGLSRSESADLIRIFQSYVTRPENTVGWRWEHGDVVIWDNRITQHYAPDDYDDLPRRLNRITIVGDVPVGIDGEPGYVLEGDASTYSPA